MSCRCKECNWPVYTKRTVSIKCVQCGNMIHCGEGPLPQPSPPKRWPLWATLVRVCKFETDKGVGDTIHRIASEIGAERFKTWAEQCGIPCGCTERQAKWNELYPYE